MPRRTMLAPVHVPPGLLHPIGPYTCTKCGEEHRRFRLVGPVEGAIYSEGCPLDGMFAQEPLEIRPLPLPDFKIMEMHYEYGANQSGTGDLGKGPEA